MSTAPETKKSGGIRDLKYMFGGGMSSLRQFGILGALIVIIALFQVLTGGKTLLPGNLINIVSQYSYILVLAIGMVMVIIAGHIDLSVGSVAAFTGIAVALAMQNWNLPWWAAIVFGLVVGAAIGAWQGFWVAVIGVPAFIVTLAGMLIFRGGNQFFGNASTVPVPSEFVYIGAGYLPEFGPETGYNNATLLLGLLIVAAVIFREVQVRRKQKRMGSDSAPMWVTILKLAIIIVVILYAATLFAGGRVGTSFPVSGIILGVLVILYSFVTRTTIVGRHVYAVGGNRIAARLSGVKDRRVDFFVMMNMSMLAALAGMIYVARAQASGPQDGNGWELDAIAAVFIGGAAVSGGIGTVTGSIIGGLVMAVLNNGLQLLSVGSDRVQIIKGVVLLVAVGIDVWNKTQGRPSIIGMLMKSRKSDDAEPPRPQDPRTPTPTDGTAGTVQPQDTRP